MLKMKTFFIACLVCAASGVSAFAQPFPNSHEVSGAAAFFRPLGSGTGTFDADVAYGYHFDDPAWEVGLRQGYTWVLQRDEKDTWRALTAPYLHYNFCGMPNQMIVPYIGGFVGAVWNDSDFDGTVGPQGGVKIYVSPSTFVAANYRYEWFFDSFGDINDRQREAHVVSLGLGYNWGGDRL